MNNISRDSEVDNSTTILVDPDNNNTIDPNNNTTIVPQPGTTRAYYFVQQCNLTKTQIINEISQVIHPGQSLTPRQLHDRYVTEQMQADLSALDEKTQRLFKTVLVDAYSDIIRNSPINLFQVLQMTRLDLRSDKAYADLIKAISFPAFKSLVDKLVANKNEQGVSLFDEATSEDLSYEHKTLIGFLGLSS